MNRVLKYKFLPALAACGLALHANSAMACAMCYGARTDSPLAQGMNWGIFSMLAVVGCVLGGVASFAIYLARRSATVPALMPAGGSLPQPEKA